MDKGMIDLIKQKKPTEEAAPPPKARVNPYAV
jgi:hypothetical protein